MTARIICVGNRYADSDDFGPRVYDALAVMPIPVDVDVLDGGIKGLDLLRHLEDAHRVVFVDALQGLNHQDGIIVLSAAEVADQCVSGFDHAAGLPYLLKLVPAVLDSPPPAVTVVPACQISAIAGPNFTTKPLMPLSRTKRFEPFPMTVICTLLFSASENTKEASSGVAGITRRSAGPPIWKVVWHFIGSPQSKRSWGIRQASTSANF